MEKEVKSDGKILGKFIGESPIDPDEGMAATVLGLQLGEGTAPFLIAFSKRFSELLSEWEPGDNIELILRKSEAENGHG